MAEQRQKVSGIAGGLWALLVLAVRALGGAAPLGENRSQIFMTVGEAADVLNVSPETLRAWEARYGFPASDQVEHGRRYDRAQVDALATRLQTDLSVPAAIAKARLASGLAPLAPNS